MSTVPNTKLKIMILLLFQFWSRKHENKRKKHYEGCHHYRTSLRSLSRYYLHGKSIHAIHVLCIEIVCIFCKNIIKIWGNTGLFYIKILKEKTMNITKQNVDMQIIVSNSDGTRDGNGVSMGYAITYNHPMLKNLIPAFNPYIEMGLGASNLPHKCIWTTKPYPTCTSSSHKSN